LDAFDELNELDEFAALAAINFFIITASFFPEDDCVGRGTGLAGLASILKDGAKAIDCILPPLILIYYIENKKRIVVLFGFCFILLSHYYLKIFYGY
jgi:hypothetical protein